MEPQPGAEWVLYLRKSKGRAGIARQRTITTAHLEQRGGTITAEFTDTDRTAFAKAGEGRPTRGGFDAMIAALRARPGLGLAAWHADRLTRNDEDTATLMAVCGSGGHLIETPRGGTYDVSTATGRKRLRDDASDAIYEVDHMRERIMAAKDEARAEGRWLGGPRPFGWDVIKGREEGEPPRLVLNGPEAALIFSGTVAVIAGASLRSVTKAWQGSGVTGPRGGAVWHQQDVGDILRRARNAGLAEYDTDGTGPQITGKGQWPAVVTEDQWRTCKAILDSPARRTHRGTQPVHLLSGIAVCGFPGCGLPLVCVTAGGAHRPRRRVYVDPPRAGKRHVTRAGDALDAYVSDLVIAWVERYGQEALNPPPPDTAPLSAQLKAAEADLAAAEAAHDEGAITMAQWIGRTRKLNQRAAALRERISTAAVSHIPAHVFTESDIRGGWAIADIDAKRAIVRALMTVTVLPVPKGQHGCPPGWKRGGGPYFRPGLVKIEWKRGSDA